MERLRAVVVSMSTRLKFLFHESATLASSSCTTRSHFPPKSCCYHHHLEYVTSDDDDVIPLNAMHPIALPLAGNWKKNHLKRESEKKKFHKKKKREEEPFLFKVLAENRSLACLLLHVSVCPLQAKTVGETLDCRFMTVNLC